MEVVQITIAEQVHKIVDNKFLEAMEEIVGQENFIEQD